MSKKQGASIIRGAGDMIGRKQRKCLRCGGMFSSRGPEHRICARHSGKSRSKYEDSEQPDPWPDLRENDF